MIAAPKFRTEPRRRQKLLYAALALVFAALTFDSVFGAHGLISDYRMRLQVREHQQRIGQLEQENREFTQQVQELKTNPAAVERVAHEHMGLVKPDQLVFQLPPASTKTPPASPSTR